MTRPLKIETRYDDAKGERTVLVNGHGVVGEYFGETFVKGYTDTDSYREYRNEPALPLSEDVLMFNKHRGYETMCLYYKNLEIYVSVDEFMAFGDWHHSKNGDWVIWCPLSMLDSVYDRDIR